MFLLLSQVTTSRLEIMHHSQRKAPRAAHHVGATSRQGSNYQPRSIQVESLELRTNTVAAYVAGGRSSEAGAVMDAMHSSAADSYELAFNRACALVEQGDYSAAEEQLQLALRTGAS